jgi:hypothetical protein
MERFLEWTEDFDSTEGDVVIDVMFDVDIFLCQDQVVDVFDFVDGGRRRCHYWREVKCRSENVMIIKVDGGKSVELARSGRQADTLVRPSEKEGSSWAAIQKSRVVEKSAVRLCSKRMRRKTKRGMERKRVDLLIDAYRSSSHLRLTSAQLSVNMPAAAAFSLTIPFVDLWVPVHIASQAHDKPRVGLAAREAEVDT